MTKEEELRLALLKLFSKSPFFIATVAEVDESDYSCTVKDFANNEYPGVRLKSSVDARNGFIIVPKINSEVIVSSLKSDSTACFVVVFGEIAKVIFDNGQTRFEIAGDTTMFNGGSLGGMIKVQKCQDNLDAIKSFIQSIHTALPAAFTAIGAGAASAGAAGATSYNTAMTGKVINFSNMENTKVKH